MKIRPIRFADINDDNVESVPHETRPGRSEMGKSTIYIFCPFCRSEVMAYLWSFHGGGKRCTCGALHSRWGRTHRWVA